MINSRRTGTASERKVNCIEKYFQSFIEKRDISDRMNVTSVTVIVLHLLDFVGYFIHIYTRIVSRLLMLTSTALENRNENLLIETNFFALPNRVKFDFLYLLLDRACYY